MNNDDIEPPQLPRVDAKQVVACRGCHSVLSVVQFQLEGCKNCGVAMDRDQVGAMTTSRFQGFVGLVDAKNSWVARFIGVPNARSGVYAAAILPDDDDDEDDEEDEEDDAGLGEAVDASDEA